MKSNKWTSRLLTGFLAVVMIASLCACGVQAQPDATRTFTDSSGREVELPAEIERVAVTGVSSQLVVFALAPDKMVALTSKWDAGAEDYIEAKYFDLPVLGQLYGGKGEWNLESLLEADPQIVIDVGETKEGIAEDMDALTDQTGIPFVHIAATTKTMNETYRMLGDLLGMPEEAAVLSEYCETHYADMTAFIEQTEKTGVLYCLGDEGLNVIAKDSYHSEVIDLVADNKAVLENPSSKGLGNETDMEQLLVWNPEVILFAPGSAYETAPDSALWQQLDAIQSGRYYLVPDSPVNWFGFPPSVQRYLGMLWLSALLYPDTVEFDLCEETQTFFRLFFHAELTDAQFHQLTHGEFAD